MATSSKLDTLLNQTKISVVEPKTPEPSFDTEFYKLKWKSFFKYGRQWNAAASNKFYKKGYMIQKIISKQTGDFKHYQCKMPNGQMWHDKILRELKKRVQEFESGEPGPIDDATQNLIEEAMDIYPGARSNQELARYIAKHLRDHGRLK